MSKTFVNETLKVVFSMMGIDLELTRVGIFAGLFPLKGTGFQKAEIEFFEDGNYIGVIFFARIYSSLDDAEKTKLQEKISQINNLPELSENGERWMRMTLSKDPIHIVTVAKIKPDEEDGFDAICLLMKFNTMFSIMADNWPIGNHDEQSAAQ